MEIIYEKKKGISFRILFLFLCFILSSNAFAQVLVKGSVVDAEGEALIGVSVVVKNQPSIGTTTDIDGAFSLKIPPGGSALIFSYIGFNPQTVPLGSKTEIRVVLTGNVTSLNETVVVGYGVKKIGSVTGSVAQIGPKELLEAPMSNVSNMLTGKLPGLTSVQSSGQPGADQTNLVIRGFSTFKDSSPLTMVDGVERMINTVNPNDIQSVTILKDASACAVYGIKGSNGVILITTKRGRMGKPIISYDASATWSNSTRFPKLLNAPDYAYWYDKARALDGLAPRFDADALTKINTGIDPTNTYGNTDWMKELMHVGFTQQQNLAVSGGSDDIRYYVSAGFMDQKGNMNNVDYRRYNIRSNIDGKITKNLSFTADLSGFYENRDWPGISLSAGAYGNPITQAIYASPVIPLTYNGIYTAWPNSGGDLENPVAAINESGYSKRQRKQFEGNFGLIYDVPQVQGLKLKITANYNASFVEDKSLLLPYKVNLFDVNTATYTETTPAYLGTGSLAKSASNGAGIMLRPAIEYDRTFAEKHHVSGLFLYEQYTSSGSTMTTTRKGYMFADPSDISLGSGDFVPIPSGSYSNAASAAFVGRVNYDYEGKYLFESSFRYDGSYKFAPKNRWGFFPSVSAGWMISKEDFMKSMTDVNSLKLRVSMGQLGKDDTSNAYSYLPSFALTGGPNYVFGTSPTPQYAFYTTNSVPSDITWSRTLNYNGGIDLTMWNGLLRVNFDYFYKLTKDILESNGGAYAPSLGGYYSSQTNSGKVESNGFELVLGHQNKIGEVSYGLEGSLAYATNKVLSQNQGDWPMAINSIGKPVGCVYGFHATGLYQTQEQLDNRPYFPQGGTPRLGDLMYQDMNGDGKITWQGDQIKIANSSMPKMSFSLNMNASYKNFDLSALWQGVSLCDIVLSGLYSNGYNDQSVYTRPFYGDGNAAYYLVEGAWNPQNTNAEYPRLSTLGSENNSWASDWWVRDGTYLRLKNLQIGYTLPQQLMKRMGLTRLRIYLAGTNLLTFSGLKYMDPEMPSIQNGYYPQQQTYSLGLNITL